MRCLRGEAFVHLLPVGPMAEHGRGPGFQQRARAGDRRRAGRSGGVRCRCRQPHQGAPPARPSSASNLALGLPEVCGLPVAGSPVKLHLMGHPRDLAIVRLDPDTTPDWDFRVGPFATITWTDTETSVVTLTHQLCPRAAREGPCGRSGRRAVEFGMYGVMAQILAALVDAGSASGDVDLRHRLDLVQSHELGAAAQSLAQGGLIYTATTLFGSTA